jgi:hypothetical protein
MLFRGLVTLSAAAQTLYLGTAGQLDPVSVTAAVRPAPLVPARIADLRQASRAFESPHLLYGDSHLGCVLPTPLTVRPGERRLAIPAPIHAGTVDRCARAELSR